MRQYIFIFCFCKGYIPGLISGKLPVEYLEQLRPDVLEEEKFKKIEKALGLFSILKSLNMQNLHIKEKDETITQNI